MRAYAATWQIAQMAKLERLNINVHGVGGTQKRSSFFCSGLPAHTRLVLFLARERHEFGGRH